MMEVRLWFKVWNANLIAWKGDVRVKWAHAYVVLVMSGIGRDQTHPLISYKINHVSITTPLRFVLKLELFHKEVDVRNGHDFIKRRWCQGLVESWLATGAPSLIYGHQSIGSLQSQSVANHGVTRQFHRVVHKAVVPWLVEVTFNACNVVAVCCAA